jgi:signal transduction histidine kinase
MTTELHRTLTHLIRACDVVFGSSSMALAAISMWQLAAGSAPLGMVIALWAVPAVNISWSLITKHRDRSRADFVRGLACVPLAAYIYVAEPDGILRHMWLPALMLSVAVCLSVGIGTRRSRGGILIACLYGGGLAVASLFTTDQLDPLAFRDAFGLVLVGSILSIVASYRGTTLGRLTDSLEARRLIEAELVHAQKLESVGRLAAGIAHEINTPVQFVNDSLHFVREAVDDLFVLVAHPTTVEIDLPYLTEEVPKALARAHDGLGRVALIVRSMRQFAHPGGELQAIDLNDAIAATLVVARNEYKYVADLETEFGALPPVECLPGELNQVVLNIVVNAAHAIAEVVGTSGARGTLHVATRRVGDDVVIAIRDTGAGIPETIRHRIFDPFFTTKEIGKGTGQGLAIARSVVVDKHHGKLTFESEIGRGTTFTIQVPLAGVRVAA